MVLQPAVQGVHRGHEVLRERAGQVRHPIRMLKVRLGVLEPLGQIKRDVEVHEGEDGARVPARLIFQVVGVERKREFPLPLSGALGRHVGFIGQGLRLLRGQAGFPIAAIVRSWIESRAPWTSLLFGPSA